MDPQQLPILGEPWDYSYGRLHRRHEPRLQLGSVRPVKIYLLRGDDQVGPHQVQASADGWVVADVLDISLGGMALLIDGAPPLERDQPVLLDVAAHPDFDSSRLMATLRWFVTSPRVITLGVQFDQRLLRLPQLTQIST